MATLRAPGGCPWDRAQTHQSLTKYAIEEAHEVAEAAESGTPHDLCEELGDLLLQVLFHAEIAQENGDFTLDDIAGGLVEKLVRRHPHVFGDQQAETAQQVERNWAEIKQQENPRAHPLQGIPTALPALMRAQKVISRAQRADLPVSSHLDPGQQEHSSPDHDIGQELLSLVGRAHAQGVDAEQELRRATRMLEHALTSPDKP